MRPSSVDKGELPLCSYRGAQDKYLKFKICNDCESVRYCSRLCQKKHWQNHQVICKAKYDVTQRCDKSAKNFGNYNSFYTSKNQSKLVNLIGRKSIVICFLFDEQCKILWDTGANIGVIDKHTIDCKFPYVTIRYIMGYWMILITFK